MVAKGLHPPAHVQNIKDFSLKPHNGHRMNRLLVNVGLLVCVATCG